MLPEQYQKYVRPAPGWPVAPGEVELYDERDPVAYVPDAYGQMVPMRRSQLPAMPVRAEPRDLAPRPVLDPLAQRMAGGGIGAGAAGAGIGWGIGQAAAGIAAIGGTTALVAMLALFLLARAGRAQVHVRQEVHQHASWFSSNRAQQ